MFDIAWSEMVLIGAVALVVIGPKDLPKVLRTVGQTVGKVRRMATEFQGQFNEAMREAELADLKKQVEDVGGSVSDTFNSDFKPIDQPNEFHAPSTAETAAAAEARAAEQTGLKQAEDKLAELPMPELPPLDIAADTPTPDAQTVPEPKPKRTRKTRAEEPVAETAADAADPAEFEAPAKPARKRSVKVVVDTPQEASSEADTPYPEVTAAAAPEAKPARKRKPKNSPDTNSEENPA